MHVGSIPAGPLVHLGCGSGQVGPALKARWPGHRLIGVDTSPNRLEEAEAFGCYDALVLADAVDWQPDDPAALIFSNALCDSLPDHARLFSDLAGMLAPGGALAVHMPRPNIAPSYAAMRDIARRIAPERFDYSDWHAPVRDPALYVSCLAPLGKLDLWETEYARHLAAVPDGHPVRHALRATALRPFEDELSADEFARFLAAYDAALLRAYPLMEDGSAVHSLRRLFFVLTI